MHLFMFYGFRTNGGQDTSLRRQRSFGRMTDFYHTRADPGRRERRRAATAAFRRAGQADRPEGGLLAPCLWLILFGLLVVAMAVGMLHAWSSREVDPRAGGSKESSQRKSNETGTPTHGR